MNFFEKLIGLLFPAGRSCLGCGAGSAAHVLCPRCQNRLIDKGGLNSCSVCGRYQPELSGIGTGAGICGECREKLPVFFAARAVGPYRGQLREMIYLYKYKGFRSLSEVFAELLAGVFVQEKLFSDSSLLVPVPVSREKIKARGFNQSELLALRLGEILKIPVYDCLVRTRHTPTQSKIAGPDRKRNVEGAFEIKDRLPAGNIILIDDILTTGATAGECARVLQEAGAQKVGVLTIASGIQEKFANSH